MDTRARRALIALSAVLVVGADVSAIAVVGGTVPASRPSAQRAHAPVRPEMQPAVAPTVVPRPVPHAWVVPAVANMWEAPSKLRHIDRLTLTAHPKMRVWARSMTLAQRLDLNGRLMTQAVRGDRVAVVSAGGRWSLVRLESQAGGAFHHGIVGWMATAQLRRTPVHPTATSRARRSVATVVRTAQGFLGVPYLWAGLSAYGIDCSGLTYVAARRIGITLPRDAADQALVGKAVGRTHLRRGDLVFFGTGARRNIHHVGIYLGRGLVLHAPHTGSTVRVTPLSAWSDYWGARRLVG